MVFFNGDTISKFLDIFLRTEILEKHIFAIFMLGVCYGLHLKVLSIPGSVLSGCDVNMTCVIDLEGDELYGIKWFRNDLEFFRFSPSERPIKQFFPLRGVHVDIDQSSNTTVLLKSVDHNSAGTYKCEASADAPHFATVQAQAFMGIGDFVSASGKKFNTLTTIIITGILTVSHSF